MIKEMKGWKVIVRATRNSVSARHGDFCLNYPLNVETFPKLQGSKIFFFKSYKDAIHYYSCYTVLDCMVVPCIARNVTKHKWMCSTVDGNQLKSFWKSKAKYKHECRSTVIQGTLLAESITCLE